MRINKGLILSTVIVALFMLTSMAFATENASILYTEKDLGSSWEYNYTFYNTSDDGESLYKVWLLFDSSMTVTGSPLPTGWTGTKWVGTDTTNYLNAQSIGNLNSIDAGGFLGGFTFTIDQQVGDISYVAEFKNSAGAYIDPYQSSTAAAIVPEPISTVLFLIGGTTLAARGWYRRKRKIS